MIRKKVQKIKEVLIEYLKSGISIVHGKNIRIGGSF